MTKAEQVEINRRVRGAQEVCDIENAQFGRNMESRKQYAERLYAKANNGYFHKTPVFYFHLSLACLRAAGLEPKVIKQEEL